MQGLREIRRRIRSVKNTQQITKAMKMVAAARLRRAQEQVLAARPYSDKMREMFLSIMEQSGELHHPLFEVRGDDRVLYIVLTAERGLCGAFNANIMKKATTVDEERILRKREEHEERLRRLQTEQSDDPEAFVHDLPELEVPEALWMPVGRKGREFLSFRGYKITQDFVSITDIPTQHLAEQIAKVAVKYFESGEVDEVYIIYSQFVSVMQQRPAVFRLLPLALPESEDIGAESAEPSDGDISQRWLPPYTYEPTPELVLHHLIPKYLTTVVLHALLETTAGELGARMTAMDSATNNAGEVIDKLTLQYNRARQASITQELTEIVSGAEALS